MDIFIRDSMKNGKDVNEVLNMPYHFVLQLFTESKKPETSGSFFDLL